MAFRDRVQRFLILLTQSIGHRDIMADQVSNMWRDVLAAKASRFPNGRPSPIG
jgi:hypothetical protein